MSSVDSTPASHVRRRRTASEPSITMLAPENSTEPDPADESAMDNKTFIPAHNGVHGRSLSDADVAEAVQRNMAARVHAAAQQRADTRSARMGILCMSLSVVACTVAMILIASGLDSDDLRTRYLHRYRHTGGRKVRDTERTLSVTLQQLYEAETLNVTVQRSVVCDKCHGRGGAHVHQCPVCGGSGMQVYARRVMGMVQHVRQHCSTCGGRGKVVEQPCEHCGQSGLVTQRSEIPVRLTGGLRHGDLIRLVACGDEHPDAAPGDLVVHLHEIEPSMHATGRVQRCQPPRCGYRSGDLEADIHLTLREALLGWTRNISVFNRAVRLDRTQVVQPGEEVVVSGAGMPRLEDTQYVRVLEGGRYVATQYPMEEAEAQMSIRMRLLTHLRAWTRLLDDTLGAWFLGPARGDLRVRANVHLPSALAAPAKREIAAVFSDE